MTTHKKIKIGFDLDGVILTNPSRILRSLIARSKKAHLFPRKELEFYHPDSTWEKYLWLLAHKSSYKLADGFTQLEQLVATGQVEAYIISARFACLKKDSDKWLKILNRQHTFKKIYFNYEDQQPHTYKCQLLKDLKLDYFVEDNWDVASYLAKNQTGTEVWWLSNFFDRTIDYPYKFFSLKAVVSKIKSFLL